MARGNAITAAQCVQIKAAWQDGAEARDIAKLLGLAASTVQKVLSELDSGVMVRVERCGGCGNLAGVWPCGICRMRGT